MSSTKQYGLQVSKKSQSLTKKHSVFQEDSNSEDSDGGGGTDWVKKSLKQTAEKNLVKRQTKLDIQRALAEDETVYQYDEIYDQLEKQKQESKPKEKERKPKYMTNLLNAADKRKRENERRVERQVQKEREEEGEQFKDKETFVTSAYKKKLEEFAKLDEEQRKQDFLEEIGDVTKQEDISGFYRHLYSATVNKEEENAKKEARKKENSPLKESSKINENKDKVSRYRKRKMSESSDDNKDKDSEESSSSSSSDSESDSSDSDVESSQKKRKDNSKITEKEISQKTKNSEEVKTKIKKSEPDKSVWIKRTIGPIFDTAFQRYCERKAARLGRAY